MTWQSVNPNSDEWVGGTENWILITGFWRDEGFWMDNQHWQDYPRGNWIDTPDSAGNWEASAPAAGFWSDVQPNNDVWSDA